MYPSGLSNGQTALIWDEFRTRNCGRSWLFTPATIDWARMANVHFCLLPLRFKRRDRGFIQKPRENHRKQKTYLAIGSVFQDDYSKTFPASCLR